MDRWACVDAFAFPLQLLLNLHPDWLNSPVAVLDRDHPQGRLVWINRHARSARLRAGMRYGQALALLPNLHAEAVNTPLLTHHSQAIARTLNDYSPRVEAAPNQPGLFWLDASGLKPLYPDWKDWVTPLRQTLKDQHQIYASVVIGFGRFQTFALARSTQKSGLFHTPEAENQAAAQIDLADLHLKPSSLELTRRLGIHTVGELLAMPPESLRRRVDKDLFHLYELARRSREDPLQAHRDAALPTREDHLDYGERNTTRLLFLLKRHLHPLLTTLEEKGERLASLTMTFSFPDLPPHESTIKVAEPTLDALVILELVRLRLETLHLRQGITSLKLQARGERTRTSQMELFLKAPPRDLNAANRALARLRAEFGDHAVQRVELRSSHLPEGRFTLHPMEHLSIPISSPSPPLTNSSLSGPAVRRFFPDPIRLSRAPVHPRTGPHIVSGGWWVRPIHRTYQLININEERLLWVFFDDERQQWYIHAEF